MSQIFRDEAEIFRILKRLLYFYVKNYAINSAAAVVLMIVMLCVYIGALQKTGIVVCQR